VKTDSPNEYKSSGGPCPVAVRAARRVFGRLVSRTIGLQGSEGPSEPADRGGRTIRSPGLQGPAALEITYIGCISLHTACLFSVLYPNVLGRF
jgi:hypothetical protein